MERRLEFYINRLGERLWVKPLLVCVVSVGGIFLARSADRLPFAGFVPDVTLRSVETLLKTLSSSMLVIATLSVASMVAAYNSASNNATPRAFPLVISDDYSQFALSTFVGAFIFSVVTLIAVQNSYYEKVGLFAVFMITLTVFAIVIVTFVRWMDCIARLGLLGNTIKKIEAATLSAMNQRRSLPLLGGVPVKQSVSGQAVFTDRIGYVQIIDMLALQELAETLDIRITVMALPGTFVTQDRPLAEFIRGRAEDAGNSSASLGEAEIDKIALAFVIGKERTFDEDPRFGLIALSQIASRAMSPAINDAGTAIDVIATHVRLLTLWFSPLSEEDQRPPKYPLVSVPVLKTEDMLDDAFGAIARDGADTVEVVVRLQKALAALASLGNAELSVIAEKHAQRALARAEKRLESADDIKIVREASLPGSE